MAMIEWSDSLSVGVKEFDDQHKVLIGMINDLHNAMKEGKGKGVVGEIVEKLIEYTDTHFKTEEKYFDQFDFPGKAAHKKTHEDFVTKVVDFSEDLSSGKITLTLDVMKFLSSWLKEHIKGTDKEYSAFFAEKGLT